MKRFTIIPSLCATLLLTSAFNSQVPQEIILPPCATMNDMLKHEQKLQKQLTRAQLLLQQCYDSYTIPTSGLFSAYMDVSGKALGAAFFCKEQQENLDYAVWLLDQFNAFDWASYFKTCGKL